MHLYHLSLQNPTSITAAVGGSFSEKKRREVVVARHATLELLWVDKSTQRIVTVHSQNVFGIIRSLSAFRLMAGEFDYLIVGSDSGKITILRFDPTANNNFGAWIKVQEETFGKTGCRRIVPGQYLAADPCGRAVMISAVEKQKFVYVLNRDSASNLIISSPLEAHKSKTIVFATCGVDNAYDNPLFACIEVNYEPYDDPSEDVSMDRVQRSLTFYELDLGLNHVTRKFTEEAPASANAIIAVPNKDSSGSGPGGVLVCCEDMLYYRRMDHPPVSVKFPRSSFLSDSDTVLIQSHTLVRNKKDFFFLLQTDHGDVFQVCVEYNDLSVSEIRVSYFDTLPTSIALVFLRPNFLVCASEFGNHFLFQIENMDGQPSEYSSSRYDRIVSYTPRKLANMVGTDEIASMSPTLDMKVADLTKEGIPQFYALCGRSSASCLRIVRHGLPVAEMAVSEMHGSPSAIWSVKRRRSDENDAYIVVSYSNATLVLSIGETVEEVSNSGFESGTPTLGVGLLGEDTLVQVFPQGIKFISVDGRQNLWRPRTSKTIAKCAINSKQILISLNGGEVVYFEHESGLIVNELDRVVVEGGSEIACLAVSDVPQNQVRGKYVVIGSIDNRVRLFSTDNPSSPLSSPLSIQGLTATPSSAVIASISESGAAEGAFARTFLYIGLKNGILIRSRLDESTGEISDTRKMFLGTRPVKLFQVTINSSPNVMALSSRSWLCYGYQHKLMTTPLSYDMLEYCSGFTSEQCPEGIVGIAGTTLRIISIEKLGQLFNQTIVPLRYTPRKLVVHPASNYLIIIESDHRAFSKDELSAKFGNAIDVDKASSEERGQDEITDNFINPPRGPRGKWASCIRVFDPVQFTTLSILDLAENEAAISVCTVEFVETSSELFLAVGIVKDMTFQPMVASEYSINIYRFVSENRGIELVHKTPIEAIPLALLAFQNRLLVGAGKALRIYDLGKKKLLRKTENRNFPVQICWLGSRGDRIYVGDIANSFHFVKFRRAEKQLVIFADSFVPRYLTSCEILDFATVAAGDKFGNICISRLPDDASDDIEIDPFTSEFAYASDGFLNSAPSKLVDISNFYVGDTVTHLKRISFIPGEEGVLFYCTLQGALGILIPFIERADIDFFSHLEMHLRQHSSPLCGRDHMAFRSYYSPVKDVIDGDLCEQFYALSFNKQQEIATELMCEPNDVIRKLEEMRSKFL